MKCKYCKKNFDSKRVLSIHITKIHPTEKKRELQKPFQCLYCEKSYDTYVSLSRHATRFHDISAPQLYVNFYLNGNWPLCKCGCCEKVNFAPAGYKFQEYKVGHISRIKNNWGHNKTAIQNSTNTRREQFRNGERTVWNKGLSVDIDDRVKNNGKSVSEGLLNNSEEIRRRQQQMKFQWKNRNLIPLTGKDHSQWKGGTSSISNLIYADNRLYKEWKFPILKETEFKCTDCI